MSNKLKLSFSVIFFFTANCFALPTPAEELNIQYQGTIEAEHESDWVDADADNNELNLVSRIPEATYLYLQDVFTSFYGKLSFDTSITDSTFVDNLHSELISVPLIANNKQGLQLELFGLFSDMSTQYFSNLGTDNGLYKHIANSEQTDLYNGDLSLGAGISFSTGQSSKVKIIISNNEMPGYGSSKTLFGFETQF